MFITLDDKSGTVDNTQMTSDDTLNSQGDTQVTCGDTKWQKSKTTRPWDLPKLIEPRCISQSTLSIKKTPQ